MTSMQTLYPLIHALDRSVCLWELVCHLEATGGNSTAA